MQASRDNQSVAKSFMEWVRENHARQPSLGAELRAIGREAMKDIRSTVMKTMLGSPEVGGEMGTPLNPTPQMTTQQLGTVYGNYNQVLDNYASRDIQPGRDR